MVVNNLIIKLKDRSPGEIEKAKKVLLGMDGKIPALLGLRVETDLRGPEKSAWDLMLATRFNSLDDLDLYLKHPAHLEVAEYMKTAMDASASLCHEA